MVTLATAVIGCRRPATGVPDPKYHVPRDLIEAEADLRQLIHEARRIEFVITEQDGSGHTERAGPVVIDEPEDIQSFFRVLGANGTLEVAESNMYPRSPMTQVVIRGVVVRNSLVCDVTFEYYIKGIVVWGYERRLGSQPDKDAFNILEGIAAEQVDAGKTSLLSRESP